MPAFSQLDFTRFDVWAIAAMPGLTTIEQSSYEACRGWLCRHGYGVTTIDLGGGVGQAVVELGLRFRWEDQFGYKLTEDRRNLNALRDGFGFDFSDGEGHVLELLNPDVAYAEDPGWLLGLLAIGSEYSRWQLALGNRFFTVLVLEPDSKLTGVAYEEANVVPVPFHRSFEDR